MEKMKSFLGVSNDVNVFELSGKLSNSSCSRGGGGGSMGRETLVWALPFESSTTSPH